MWHFALTKSRQMSMWSHDGRSRIYSLEFLLKTKLYFNKWMIMGTLNRKIRKINSKQIRVGVIGTSQSLHELFLHSGLCNSYLSFGNQKTGLPENEPSLPLVLWKLLSPYPQMTVLSSELRAHSIMLSPSRASETIWFNIPSLKEKEVEAHRSQWFR